MNDFTKEELLQLSFAIYAYPHNEDDHIYGELRNKIKSMIDNYCEHESDGKSYCPGLYDKVCAGNEIYAIDLTRVSKCSNCNRYFE